MTTYIDSPSVATPDGIDGLSTSPLGAAMPGLFALWSLPITAFQVWTNSWSTLLAHGGPEEDRDQPAKQLPVPNPLQKAKDSELFA